MLRITSRTLLNSHVQETVKGRSLPPTINEIVAADFSEIEAIGDSPARGIFILKHIPTDGLLVGKLLNQDVSKSALPAEIRMTCNLLHPRLVRGYGYIKYSDNEAVLLQEYIPGQDLGKKIQSMHEMKHSDVMRYMTHVMEAVDYLHTNNIAHRDIKASNIVIDDLNNSVKLIDLGLACHVGNVFEAQIACGSPASMAPEVWNMVHDGTDNTPIDLLRADVWSCGILFFTMLFGTMPWQELSLTPERYIKVMLAQCPLVVGGSSLLTLLRSMLYAKPKKRPRASDVLQALKGQAFGVSDLSTWRMAFKYTRLLSKDTKRNAAEA
ncbi:CAMK/CAMKL protein kinase [Sphaeroforma arctica JP610]|uniref:CAMK/CAMKL protein kinase n=1 Tax=Sphaeroforma arctica JP610 TaxID=667725 RepID=A0A0L0FN11_9EUKA|nr:CAMK/CAMKL protein kinase [Sphaeroforma arctica JP610]KNC78124.1 CAMK/CAMKL protein kinase [Sphaeroforma arctica JP610]|eukprot:XP_014152026.1 CAMK/CAMKL protein kinase [Sphaeroforma arctica JP610]